MAEAGGKSQALGAGWVSGEDRRPCAYISLAFENVGVLKGKEGDSKQMPPPPAARGGVMEGEGVSQGSWVGPCAPGLRRGVFDPVTPVLTPICVHVGALSFMSFLALKSRRNTTRLESTVVGLNGSHM